MIVSAENVALVRGYCATYGIDVSDEQVALMLRHLELVIETNKQFNLTRIVDEHDALIRHVVDSLLFVPSVTQGLPVQRKGFVDIGTGAGFPGIPVAIATGMPGILIDSVGKKVKAVQSFLSDLDLEYTLHASQVRAERLAQFEHEQFECVLARAVADLGVLVEYASPLLRQGGRLVVSKGQIEDDELVRGRKTGEIVGMHEVSRETYELPEGSGHREIITYIHDGASKIKLPRKTGMAKHKPLCE